MRQTFCRTLFVHCFIVLFALLASTLSLQPPHDPILEKCKNDHHVTEISLSTLHSNPELLLSDPKTRCFTACILTEIRTLKPDGTLNTVPLIENLPKNMANQEEVIEALNSCANEKGVDSCETAYKTAVCVNSKEAIRNMYPSE